MFIDERFYLNIYYSCHLIVGALAARDNVILATECECGRIFEVPYESEPHKTTIYHLSKECKYQVRVLKRNSRDGIAQPQANYS